MNKKFATLAILLSVTRTFALTAPERTDLIEALVIVESNGRANAIGDNGKAFGILQIHQVMVNEANRIGGTNFTHRDMFTPSNARRVAEIVLGHYDRHIQKTTGKDATAKQLSFIWNGGGSAWRRVDSPVDDTKQANLERYWLKVSKTLKR
jgi:hypothetical protein